MSWVATAIAGGTIGSALIGANAAKGAARTAADAAAANRPAPVDINQAMQNYIASISNRGLQGSIIGAESEFRPQYLDLNAADLQAGLIGTGGSRGALDFVSMSADRMAELNQRLATQNVEYQLDQLKAYGPEATAAYLAANPNFANAVRQMEALSGRQASGYLNAMGDLAMQPGTGQAINAPSINAPANVTANQITSGGTLAADLVNAERIGSTGTLTPQQVSAMMMGPIGAITPDRVTANLMGPVGRLTADQVAAERVAAERVAAGQVSAGEVGAGALGQSLYQQALANQQLSPLSQALQAQGLGMATAPGQITAAEARAATQGARERFASTGRLEDISAITGEALARAGAARERQMQDVATAQAINAQLLGAQQTGQSLATDVLRADIARQQANVATGLQASTFNVDAAMRAALANQQTGLQAGMANQDAMLRAALANQQANLQAGQFNIGNDMAINQANMAAQNQFALANQQAGLTAADINARNQLAVQQANQAAGNQFTLANMQAGLEAGRFNISNATELARLNQAANLQANLANQDAAARAAQFNITNAQDVNRFNISNAFDASRFNADVANRMAEANRTFNYTAQQDYLRNLGLLGQSTQGVREADRAYALNQVGAYGGVSNAGLNATSYSQPPPGVNAAMNYFTLGSNVTPNRTFDPNAGVNLAAANAANLSNYGANIYSANQTRAAAEAAAAATRSAGKSSMFGNILGGALGGIFGKL